VTAHGGIYTVERFAVTYKSCEMNMYNTSLSEFPQTFYPLLYRVAGNYISQAD